MNRQLYEDESDLNIDITVKEKLSEMKNGQSQGPMSIPIELLKARDFCLLNKLINNYWQ